jgi:nucleotide-binding universal stress UspA family protein
MSKPTHLLLVSQSVEQEQKLFAWTLAFAKQHGATVTVLRVLPEIDHGVFYWFTEVVADVTLNKITPEEVKAKQCQNVLTELSAWQAQAKAVGVVLDVQVLFGKLFYRAIQYVLNQSVDWLIKQTDEASHSLTEHIFDSHDLHLLRKCPCSVLLYKHGTPLPFKKVMACLDVNLDEGFDLDRESNIRHPDELNQRILGEAINMVSAELPYLEVLHAWQADAENLVRHWNTDFSEEDMFRFTETIRHQHLTAIEVEINALNTTDVEIEYVLPKGKAEEVIPPIVEQHKVDLLVMGTLGRHGLPGIIIGNTSESILEQVNCSVLALKPNDFISPVKPSF